ncbi:hypothetical protein KTR66_14440 [Roseococcus sp. SDR]|uniref:hypothetical protein n=1 Tax=Roseococcus sp. SDR TaxID=2835532 RepID=UPI001BD19113|nr:hypothetical protein [Roseococcus sp. SDR]MBS7791199.1 hypothetical protein [Roseococcus sp. SDR]MBV1846513.1 hypothetical protein [Roseococcus sp. SDR]
MLDFSPFHALGLLARTWPFLLLRLLTYGAISFAYVALTAGGAGIGWLIGALGSQDFRELATLLGGAIGFGTTFGIVYLLREYMLYLLKAGHIAVMIELMEGRGPPSGRAQIRHAIALVRERFIEASLLFALDQLVRGVLETIFALMHGLSRILIPTGVVGQLLSLLHAIMRLLAGVADEVILGHALRTQATNPWNAAREALVLYAQNAGGMFRNSAFLLLIGWVLSLLIFLLLLTPAAGLTYAIPGAWSAGGLAFALVFAWSVKAALIEPFQVACLLQAFFRLSAGQQPDPAWEARIAKASRPFRSLIERGLGGAAGR